MSTAPRNQRSVLDMDREITELRRERKNLVSENASLKAEIEEWKQGAQVEADEADAQREINKRLKAEVEKLKEQLPHSMKHCTIVFEECEKGHGWLTATNWGDFSCPTCALTASENKRKELANAIIAIRQYIGLRVEAALQEGGE